MLPIKDINPTRRAPVITRALLALNVLAFVPVFYVAYVLGDADLYAELMMTWGLVPSRLLLGQSLYALLTSMFMHAHILHLVGNMIYLRVFGDNVEDVLGRPGYLFFYLLCGLTATFTHVLICILTASGLNVPVVGASGAISGILGAYVVFFPGARILTYTAYRAIYV
ncbi:MAG TPA: rhomboid family intramembrane serine protease, partial [Candidatus Bathyarchaeota archaeon]|nr:rhomboid family intramembrane serine protease [Candidatus Bathyarchaeota archaeon]